MCLSFPFNSIHSSSLSFTFPSLAKQIPLVGSRDCPSQCTSLTEPANSGEKGEILLSQSWHPPLPSSIHPNQNNSFPFPPSPPLSTDLSANRRPFSSTLTQNRASSPQSSLPRPPIQNVFFFGRVVPNYRQAIERGGRERGRGN